MWGGWRRKLCPSGKCSMFLNFQNTHRLCICHFEFWVGHLPVKREIRISFTFISVFLILDINAEEWLILNLLLFYILSFLHKLKSNPQPSTLRAKGSCQVEKIQKIREKLGLARQHQPTSLYNFIFFFWKHVQQHKTTQKIHNFQKKRKSEFRLDPRTHFRIFLGFFNLTKPLTGHSPVSVCSVISRTYWIWKGYLQLCIVANTPFHIKGNDIMIGNKLNY